MNENERRVFIYPKPWNEERVKTCNMMKMECICIDYSCDGHGYWLYPQIDVIKGMVS